MFNLKNSQAYKTLHYPIRSIIATQVVFALLWLISFFSFIFPKVYIGPEDFTEQEIFGMFLLLCAVNIWLLFLWMFYVIRLRHISDVPSFAILKEQMQKDGVINNLQEIDTAQYLDFYAARAIYRAAIFAKKKNILFSPLVLLHTLLMDKRTDFLFSRLLIVKKDFKKSIEVIVGSQYKKEDSSDVYANSFYTLMESVFVNALKGRGTHITQEDIFSAIVADDKTIQRLFFDFGAKKEDVLHVLSWEKYYYDERKPRPFLHNIKQFKGIVDDWIYGYTPTLDIYAKDLVVHSKESKEHTHIFTHTQEIDELEIILNRSGKNNVVLVGEAGVGKKSIITGFAQRLLYGTSLPALAGKRLVILDTSLVLAQVKDNASALALFDTIFTEAEHAGNVILVIENIKDIVGTQRKENVSGVDLSGILVPYLQSDLFQLIALVGHGAYHGHIEQTSSLSVLFEKIEVSEINEEQTLLILEDMAPYIEMRDKIFISYYALFEIVNTSGSFIQNIPFPAKAISLLSEVISYVHAHKTFGNVVTQDHVTEVISKKTGIPLGRIEGAEKSKLLNMEKLLHERIIGQNEAIIQIASALRRIRSGITERKRPIGTFLFLGPTGVGKTETAKALAAIYFGDEERMIRLDMTEYQEASSINRLIGNPDTQTEAQFANQVRSHPFSLVLLDELEKSHINVTNLFLQILDEGRLTDAFQKNISFRNTMIIATSNAASEFIREYIKTGQNLQVIQEKVLAYLMKHHIYKPEFLNRFDAVIVFEPLVQKQVEEIAQLMLRSLRGRLESKGYLLHIDDELLHMVAEKGFDAEFGARNLRRFVQEKIENTIAEKIIKGEYKPGDTISLTTLDLI